MVAMTEARTTAPRPPRREDAANRERLLHAARQVFAERGLDVGVDEIARSAGVGMGTLYRRFPTKASLVNAIFEQGLDELQPAIDAAVANESAWDGLVEMLVAVVAQQAKDHGFGQMVVLR